MPYEHWINRKKKPDQCKGIPIFPSLQTREREPVFFFIPVSQRLAKLLPFVNTHLQKKNHSLLQKQTVSCEVTYVITRHLRWLVNNIHENNCNLSYIFYFFFLCKNRQFWNFELPMAQFRKVKNKKRLRKRFAIYERYSLQRTFYTYRLNIYLRYRSSFSRHKIRASNCKNFTTTHLIAMCS